MQQPQMKRHTNNRRLLQGLLSLSLVLGGGASAQLLDTMSAVSIGNSLGTGPSSSVSQQAFERAQNVRTPKPATAVAATGTQAPTPAYTADQLALLNDGYNSLRSGGAVQAIESFERLIAEDYNQPESHFGLALAYIEAQRYDEARFELERLAALAPERHEGHYNLGVLASRAGDHDGALHHFTNAAATLATASQAGQRRVLEALAREQARIRDLDGLKSTLEAMRGFFPNDGHVALRLAQVKTLAGDSLGALPDAYQAMKDLSSREKAAALLSAIYLEQHLPERALNEALRAYSNATTNSGKSALLVAQARAKLALGQPQAALEDARRATVVNRYSAEAHSVYAQMLSENGDTKGALASYRRAAHVQPQNASVRAELAALRLNMGDYAQSRQDALQALGLKPDPMTKARAEFVLGVLDHRSKLYTDGIARLHSSVQANPTAETHLWLGMSQYKAGDYAGAVSNLSESVRLKPTVNAQRNLASAQLAAGQSTEAILTLQAMLHNHKSDAQGWYLLGLAQRQNGDEAAAKKSLQTASRLGSKAARSLLR